MAKNLQAPIKVLHVVGKMDRGGVETWLMHVLRNIDRDRVHMDFQVETLEPGAFDDEARALGSKIIPCLYPRRPWLYRQNFRRVLREHGPYRIVHSHEHHYSGYILWLASQVAVPIRIAHSHNDTSQLQAAAGPLRRVYLRLMERLIEQHATISLAASHKAAIALFGAKWEKASHKQILHYGIDLAPFQIPIDSLAARAQLGIPSDAFVICHVGRFVEQKNHSFLLDIAAEVAKHEPKMHLLLIGDGPLRPVIERKVADLQLTQHVIFLGQRADVPNLMRGVMDIFLFPSLFEGLGLVLIEAQAAGRPCVMSNVIPVEVDLIPALIRRISLESSVSIWAKAILDMRMTQLTTIKIESVSIVEHSPFSIQKSVQALESIYHV